jgi:uncharacterized protein YjeT (DUF2065 family)
MKLDDKDYIKIAIILIIILEGLISLLFKILETFVY